MQLGCLLTAVSPSRTKKVGGGVQAGAALPQRGPPSSGGAGATSVPVDIATQLLTSLKKALRRRAFWNL